MDIPINNNYIILADGDSYKTTNTYPKLNFLKVFNIPLVNHQATISYKQANESFVEFPDAY